jgi:hypothetical protein
VWNPDFDGVASSFRVPLVDPGTEPDAPPFVCIRINKEWAPIAAGCALQPCQPEAWAETNPTLLSDLLARSQVFANLFGFAGTCVGEEDGTVDITILAGNGTASAAIVFTGTYTTPPVLLVSTNDPALTASWSDVTTTGANVHLTSSVPVVLDTTGTVSWLAGA